MTAQAKSDGVRLLAKGACEHCGKAVIWARTKRHNRTVIIDVEPSEKGNLKLTRRGGKAIVEYQLADGGESYVAHAATCTNASKKAAG